MRDLCLNVTRLLQVIPLLLVTACASTPPTAVHQPMSARPAPKAEVFAGNGSIYQPGSVRSLFEDRRARYVGDTLTINIVEKNQASTDSSTATEKTSAVTAAVDGLTRVPGKSFLGLGVNGSSSNAFDGSGKSAASNAFTGTITGTVVDVMPNGNLIVSGEKQVAINQGQEFIRFSGVVNPNNVTAANTVNSSQVADARIEYKASGSLNEAQVIGWLARFFLTFLPF
jgi:flagellar L-ring protein precursor FlgH